MTQERAWCREIQVEGVLAGMPVESERRLLERAAGSQHGVFTIEQARAAGMSESQIKHRLASGAWRAVFVGCYRMIGTPLRWRGRLLAACWSGADGAIASHRSAAALWQLPGGRETPAEITCPRWLRGRHPDVVVHESMALSDRDRTTRDGIPVTTIERTLLDLAAVTGDATVEMALDTAARRELTTYVRVRATIVRLSKPGRRGVRRLRRALDLRSPESALTASEAETLLLRILRRHGLPRPVLQHRVLDGSRFVGRVDAAYPEQRIAIEYESFEWHTGRVAHERDAVRRREMQALGWAYVPATAADLRTGGSDLARDLRRLLSLRRH